MSTRPRLTRSRDDRMVGGVCAGIAKYLNMDPTIVRVVWVLITVLSLGLAGVVVYAVLIMVLPEDDALPTPDDVVWPGAEPGPAPQPPHGSEPTSEPHLQPSPSAPTTPDSDDLR